MALAPLLEAALAEGDVEPLTSGFNKDMLTPVSFLQRP